MILAEFFDDFWPLFITVGALIVIGFLWILLAPRFGWKPPTMFDESGRPDGANPEHSMYTIGAVAIVILTALAVVFIAWGWFSRVLFLGFGGLALYALRKHRNRLRGVRDWARASGYEFWSGPDGSIPAKHPEFGALAGGEMGGIVAGDGFVMGMCNSPNSKTSTRDVCVIEAALPLEGQVTVRPRGAPRWPGEKKDEVVYADNFATEPFYKAFDMSAEHAPEAERLVTDEVEALLLEQPNWSVQCTPSGVCVSGKTSDYEALLDYARRVAATVARASP